MQLRPRDAFCFRKTRARVAPPAPPRAVRLTQKTELIEAWTRSCIDAYAALHRMYRHCTDAQIRQGLVRMLNEFYEMSTREESFGSYWFRKEDGYAAELALLRTLYPTVSIQPFDGIPGTDVVFEERGDGCHILRPRR